MKRFQAIVVAFAMTTLLFLANGRPAEAYLFSGWEVSIGPVNAGFSDVAIVSGDRIFSGFELDTFTFSFDAKLFRAVGAPGDFAMTEIPIGSFTYPSQASSIEADGFGEYWVTVQESLPSTEFRSHVMPSTDLLNPISITGPAPGFDPDVSLVAVNRSGIVAGDEDGGTLPLISTALGASWNATTPGDARLTSVDSTGTLFGGESYSNITNGMVAMVYNDSNSSAVEDLIEGIVWDVEGDTAVGSRDGYAVFWRRVGGVYEVQYIEEGGQPLLGELLTIDHNGTGIAGGYLFDGRAIVVETRIDRWFDIEDQLPIPSGTLNAVVAVSSEGGQIAFAGTSSDFSGWDIAAVITPEAVPGPALWIAPALLLVGMRMTQRRPEVRGSAKFNAPSISD